MLFNLKYRIVKLIEAIPLLQIFIYNNLEKFNFLFPHDKDYNGIKLLFHKNEKRDFLDIGANIGLSTIGFREMGFKSNNIHLFEPDNFLIKEYLNKIKKKYSNVYIHKFLVIIPALGICNCGWQWWASSLCGFFGWQQFL